jgi:serine/threonine-protein kinase
MRSFCKDERAIRRSFMNVTESIGMAPDSTRTWYSAGESEAAFWPPPVPRHTACSIADASGFSHGPGVSWGLQPQPVSQSVSVRARLRELPLIHIFLLAVANLWRWTVLGDDDACLRYLDAFVMAFLAGALALLWSRRHLSSSWLQLIELGMIGLLSARLTIVEYRLVLALSLRNDPMLAQFVTKNVVLLFAILIPGYGLYVPKNWRPAALVVGPLALLPFATLAALRLIHPEAMGWLGRGWEGCESPRYVMFTFDALVLFILAVASTFGARAISQLRRQVAEARRLGPYHLGRQLGAGGMGEVYLAEHQLLKRPCALKLIRPDSAADPSALKRFEREVRMTAALSHPNIVEIYDYGHTRNGTYYYVMEYLPGLTLGELVERYGPLPAGRVVHLLRQVCQALCEAHAAGLIHRDIKPSNILVSHRGGKHDVAKLLDFGLVLPLAHCGSPHLSGESRILGTPRFMSPEQARGGGQVDGRSDIYCLGAVAYYLLTGRPPFEVGDHLLLLIAHAREPVVPPSLVCDFTPLDLERVVLRCLAKDPAHRFQDAESLNQALGECVCASDWNQGRAAVWWQGVDRTPSRQVKALEPPVEKTAATVGQEPSVPRFR